MSATLQPLGSSLRSAYAATSLVNEVSPSGASHRIWLIQGTPEVGPILAATFVAEIGEVTRFARPAQLAS